MEVNHQLKNKIGPYAVLITKPASVLVTGKCGSGKTTLVVDMVNEVFPDMDLYFAFVPSFYVQATFEPIRHLFRRENVFTTPTELNMKTMIQKIKTIIEKCEEKKIRRPNFFILVDDMSGSSIFHSNRKGIFSNFAVQYRHWNVSWVIISQQPSTIDPNFRDNLSSTIVFPSERRKEVEWLEDSYNSPCFGKEKHMHQIMRFAWMGGKETNEEFGQHFLFIHSAQRGMSRFFVDFNSEICF